MQQIKIDFDNPGLPQRLDVVENDSQSRFFQATLYKDGKAYTAPSGATYSIMYRGFGPQNEGWYDTINDGAGKRAACTVSGNVVTCEIARQALRVPGHVSVVLCVTSSNGYMLHGWPIDCNCRNDSYTGGTSVESYFYITKITNADWTSAIQTWEELKNMIDPTLSIEGKAADAAKVGEKIEQTDENLSHILGNYLTDTYQKPESGNYVKNYPYNFIAGHSYTIKNGSSTNISFSASYFTRLSQTGENIEVIKQSTIIEEIIHFVPTQNANYLRISANDSNSFEIYDDSDVRIKIEDLEETKAEKTDLSQYLEVTPEKTETFFAFAVQKSATYEIANTTTGSDKGISIFTVAYKYASTNIEALVVDLRSNQSVVKIPENTAPYIKVVCSSLGTSVSIKKVGTVDDRLKLLENVGANVKVEKSKNLHNPRTDTYGYVVLTSGELKKTESYYLTDYIKIGEGNAFTVPTWNGITSGSGVKDIAIYDESKTFIKRESDVGGGKNYTYQMPDGAEYVRLNVYLRSENVMVNIGNSLLSYVPYDQNVYGDNMQDVLDDIDRCKNIPIVEFTINHTLYDTSSVIEQFDYSKKYEQNDVLEQVYAKFDSLCQSYPEYVSKSDCAEMTGLSYPDYANGAYDSTPAYKTYMYKFIYQNDKINTRKHKKKILIVSGVHGNEIAAPVNTYIFAQQLCNGIFEDENFYKLRASFDFYFVPCLNGWGMYNLTRGNANKVNINRNFPTSEWYLNGESTKESSTANEYTGESAGSEFETQIIMGITDAIHPDVCIDHHNYSVLDKQFYTDQPNSDLLPLVYQTLVDCMIAFKKNLPQYFGDKFDALTDGNAPANTGIHYLPTTTNWWYEHGITVTSTVEVSECINFVDGKFNSSRNDDFGKNAFAVCEYTLKNHILHYCQYVLKNSNS